MASHSFGSFRRQCIIAYQQRHSQVGELCTGASEGGSSLRGLPERHRARLDDGAREFLRPLLRQIVAGAAEHAMLVSPGEFFRMMRRAGVHAVGVAVDGDGRNLIGGCFASAASIGA